MGIAGCIDIGEENLVGRLVQDTGNAEHEQRPGIVEHTAEKLTVEDPSETAELFAQTTEQDAGTGKVDVEGISHVLSVDNGKVDEVHRDIQCDVQQLQRCKLQGSFLVTQIGEWYGRESIDADCNSHHPDVLRMIGIAHGLGDRLDEKQHKHDEGESQSAYGNQCGTIDAVGILALLVGETEESGLHTKQQDDHDEGRIGIDIGDDAITAGGCCQFCRIKRDEQVVEKPADDAR